MSEKSNSVTLSTSADYLIGYERILDYFKQAQKECPKGVGLKGVADSRYESTFRLMLQNSPYLAYSNWEILNSYLYSATPNY